MDESASKWRKRPVQVKLAYPANVIGSYSSSPLIAAISAWIAKSPSFITVRRDRGCLVIVVAGVIVVVVGVAIKSSPSPPPW